jgi:hypothetical protein
MDATPFTVILSELLGRVPGAYAAALIDVLGETVDYTGLSDPYDMKIAAAYLRICLQQLQDYGALGQPRWITIRGAKKTAIARQLDDGYALVVLLRKRAGFTASRRAFAACARDLAREAGWPVVEEKPAWYPVEVESDRRGRPRRVGELPVEVLGAIVGLPPYEHGFRVRTSDGAELNLVREPRSCWYSDQPREDLKA